MKKILFICTGNTCRSQMAEGIFNSLVSKNNFLKNEFVAISSGISTFDGQPPNSKAVSTLHKLWNLDISNQISNLVNETMIKESYLILTMTENHKNFLLNQFPLYKNKVYSLLNYLDPSTHNKDIDDPYGFSDEIYESCSKELHKHISLLINCLETFKINQKY